MSLNGRRVYTAPPNASSLQLPPKWTAENEQWRHTVIEEAQYGYLWGGGIYVKGGTGRIKNGPVRDPRALKDGGKHVLAVGYCESLDSWTAVRRQLKEPGLMEVRLMEGDGNLEL